MVQPVRRVGAPPWRPHSAERCDPRIEADQGVVKRRARAISNARLNGSPRLQLRPIDQVVYLGPYRKGNSSRRRLPAEMLSAVIRAGRG